jgi:hypothetical protein
MNAKSYFLTIPSIPTTMLPTPPYIDVGLGYGSSSSNYFIFCNACWNAAAGRYYRLGFKASTSTVIRFVWVDISSYLGPGASGFSDDVRMLEVKTPRFLV